MGADSAYDGFHVASWHLSRHLLEPDNDEFLQAFGSTNDASHVLCDLVVRSVAFGVGLFGAGRRGEAAAAEHHFSHGRPVPRRLPGGGRQPRHHHAESRSAGGRGGPILGGLLDVPLVYARSGRDSDRPGAVVQRHAWIWEDRGTLSARTAADVARGGLLRRGHRQDALRSAAQLRTAFAS